MIERWKPVPGLETRYEVSDRARVWSVKYGKVMKQYPVHNSGHWTVHLYLPSGKRWHVGVHRLMALAFIPGDHSLDVCHKDGIPTDNRIENLYWGTESQDILDAVRHGRHNMASKVKCRNGHPYDKVNTGRRFRPDGSSERYCKKCRIADSQRSEAKKNNRNTIHPPKGTTMKLTIISLALSIPLILAPVAQASPAMCGNHVEYGDASTGMHKDDSYITACGGDSGPDAAGNNATAPQVGRVLSAAPTRDGRSDVVDVWFEERKLFSSEDPLARENLTAFYVFGTGHPTPWTGWTRYAWNFIDTVVTPSGLVWHVFTGPRKGEAIPV